jgi:hypothetical protein
MHRNKAARSVRCKARPCGAEQSNEQCNAVHARLAGQAALIWKAAAARMDAWPCCLPGANNAHAAMGRNCCDASLGTMRYATSKGGGSPGCPARWLPRPEHWSCRSHTRCTAHTPSRSCQQVASERGAQHPSLGLTPPVAQRLNALACTKTMQTKCRSRPSTRPSCWPHVAARSTKRPCSLLAAAAAQEASGPGACPPPG